MQSKALLITLLVIALVGNSLCEKPKKLKKYVRKQKPVAIDDQIQMMENDDLAEKKASESGEEMAAPSVPIPPEDPCHLKHCGAGRVCQTNEQGAAECVCVPECSSEHDSRRRVCSNHNETWDSDCHVHQMRCWCDQGHPNCRKSEYKHLHIDYYGVCKDMPECQQSEMLDFPRRMREWLFNIMRDMADRAELTPHYLAMEQEAETNMTKRWSNAAVWKWCDLDGHPHDRTVSRHELFPIRAPLMSLEHCIAPFLNNCDVDDDHRITLKEWGKCLELPEDDLEDKCDEIREEEEARG